MMPYTISLPEAVTHLKNGDIVAIPTETVYGLAVDANNPAAIEKLYALKCRAKNKPFAIAIAQAEDIKLWGNTACKTDLDLLTQTYWPGPLTLILPALPTVDPRLASAQGSIGLRCSSALSLQHILKALDRPLCLTSANISGTKEAVSAHDVYDYFRDDLVIYANDQDISGTPSTILDLSHKPYRLLRPGSISKYQLETLLGSDIL